ncbi:hypothetical protein ACLK29_05130 [Leptospira kirschneri]|uniref:hypothetical protein n=1 Tax=Leptospira kirschneri TaxID=29507 RepID=UPI0002BDD5BC|nr:hypothetical protein [Leptospira kirschneri]EMK18893.1 hypothetical protein LEP1GSC042_1767 [Leptospira kirschneri serovar Bim str. PUO 1247]EMN06247.1 hypothetical protein LEP1GSC046_1123 [Leptospira kirschneri serovar Bim str. 1051]
MPISIHCEQSKKCGRKTVVVSTYFLFDRERKVASKTIAKKIQFAKKKKLKLVKYVTKLVVSILME